MSTTLPRRLAAGAAIAAAIALVPASAHAANTATATGTITAGGLAVSTSAAPTFSATLDGADKLPTFQVPLTVTDATGSGTGWNTTITSTQYTTGGGAPKTLATTASSVTGVSAACAPSTTCTVPTNGTGYPLTVPSGAVPPTAVKLASAAAATGMGQIDLTPTVAVSVPATTIAGTYTSTLTFAVVSGP